MDENYFLAVRHTKSTSGERSVETSVKKIAITISTQQELSITEYNNSVWGTHEKEHNRRFGYAVTHIPTGRWVFWARHSTIAASIAELLSMYMPSIGKHLSSESKVSEIISTEGWAYVAPFVNRISTLCHAGGIEMFSCLEKPADPVFTKDPEFDYPANNEGSEA